MPESTPEHRDSEYARDPSGETPDPRAYRPWRALCATLGTTNPAEIVARVRALHRLASLTDDATSDTEAGPATGMVAIGEVENVIREMHGRLDELRRRNEFLVKQLAGAGDAGVEHAFRALYEETARMYEALQATTTNEAVGRIRSLQTQLNRLYAEKEILLDAGVGGFAEAIETIHRLRSRLASSDDTSGDGSNVMPEATGDALPSIRKQLDTLQAAHDALGAEHQATQRALKEAHQAQQDIQNELRVVRSVLESSRNQSSLLQLRLAERTDELILARAEQESLQEEVDISDEALALAEAELDEARTDAKFALQEVEALKQEVERLKRDRQRTPQEDASSTAGSPSPDDADAIGSGMGNIVPLPSMKVLSSSTAEDKPDTPVPSISPAPGLSDAHPRRHATAETASEADTKPAYTTQELQAGLALEGLAKSDGPRPYFRVIGTPPFASPEILTRLDVLSESALNQLSFGVFRLDAEGIVQYANKAGLSVLAPAETAQGDVRGQHFFADLIPDAADGRFHERFRDGIRQGGIDAVFPFAFAGAGEAPQKRVVHLYRAPEAPSTWILMKPMDP